MWIALGALAAPAAAQQDDQESPYQPGLVATYTAGGASATRIDEVVAFEWQTAACDPRLPAGPFAAVWRGRLLTQSRGAYRLQCYVQGEVEIKLAGTTLITGKTSQPQWLSSLPVELQFDRHELEITFRKTGERAQLALFWSGPDFCLEPITERFLMHNRDQAPAAAFSFERGRQLAAALRCAACHKDEAGPIIPAPALDRLSGNIHQPWLVEWLSTQVGGAGDDTENKQPRRMPELAMTRPEAEAVAAWLFREPPVTVQQKQIEQKVTEVTKGADKAKKANEKGGKKAKGGSQERKPEPSAAEGERLVLTRGCLACHQLGQLDESGLLGGGDLTALAAKRPADFLVRWLENPAAINRQHRMPVFEFTRDELESLQLWARDRSSQGPDTRALRTDERQALLREGEKLVAKFRCANCHVLSRDKENLAAATQPPLTATSDWSRSCSGQPERAKGRPGYRMAAADQAALKSYYSQPRPGEGQLSPQARGRDLLMQLNCLACHQREGIDLAVIGTGAPTERIGVPLAGDGTRSVPTTMQDKLTAVAAAHDELAPLVPAMTPPALNSVGDKLHDAALADAIRRKGPPHRPYLLVQMPNFNLTDAQLADLIAYFTATDRVPSGAGFQPADRSPGHPLGGSAPREESVSRSETTTMAALIAAGPRLVTADGLACTSCHQVGSVLPAKAQLNARGPDMSMLGQRIRREWFDRWCDNPARIVPRMEMPSVQVPVRGVLNEKIDDQLAAVWHILNTPGFEPPEPNPVRVLRLSGVPERNERPIVIHDVVKDGDKTYLFPLVIGLPNRHNILFDLETNRLAAWWLGDTARQRTNEKSWYWEMGGKSILDPGFEDSEISMVVDGEKWIARPEGQFTCHLYGYSEELFGYRLTPGRAAELPFPARDAPTIRINQRFMTLDSAAKLGVMPGGVNGKTNGFCRVLEINGSGGTTELRLKVVDPGTAQGAVWDEENGALSLAGPSAVTMAIGPVRSDRYLRNIKPKWNRDGTISLSAVPLPIVPPPTVDGPWTTGVVLGYSTPLPADAYLTEAPPAPRVQAAAVQVAPGFEAIRLPLLDDIMPTGFAWDDRSSLLFCTLKGQVYRSIDLDVDGLEDSLTCIADGLPTPYGLCFEREDHQLVAVKNGLVELIEDSKNKTTTRLIAVSGWGYTDDYHDWAVGPIRGDNGEYFVALPCQQDQRSDAAAKYRGQLLKLVPQRNKSEDYPHRFDIEVISAGHRFPMGMARNREGELFVTDNQGNYNPFNELNHVRKGAHFGFINALEKQQGFKPPPLTEPAIDIPHPWTRSVNGICFLDTPLPSGEGGSRSEPGEGVQVAASAKGKSIFGPLEGHLIGCEYDTRRLIRMTLQKVGDTYQGAAYPLSIPPADIEKGFLGPIVCAVKPSTGELYVGDIRDSGWGAGNNIGQIVKIKIEPEKLPCGIGEVRATATAFTVDFFQPVDWAKAADVASYSISSYRRESTPAYGGPDLDRRAEKITAAEVSPDGKRVTLTLTELRAGHVYELHLKNLAPGGGEFHPDEAHYTLRQIP